MEAVKLQSFNWSISNQVNFRIPACEPWRLNVNRTSIPDFLPSYLLTIFPIGNGKDPKTILIEAENGANEFDWVVDEPIGSKVVLRLRDTNGAEGGYLPHLFEIVAGRSTECIRSVQAPVHSEFSFRSDVVEQPDHSKAIHVDVHGGIPPYEATLISMKSSGAQAILPVPFYQSPLFRSIEIIRNDSILIVVSDSAGKWAEGSSVFHFGESQIGIPNAQTSDLEAHSIFPMSNAQYTLSKRSSDDGTVIIVVDIIALAMLIIVTVAIILCDVRRRRRRRQLAQLAHVMRMPNADESSAVGDLEAARQVNEDEGPTEAGMSNNDIDDGSKIVSGDVMKSLSLPPPPPPTPATSSGSRQSRISSLTSSRPTIRGLSTSLYAPSAYGDPYAHPSGDAYTSDVQSMLSRKTSSSSNNTAKLIAKFHAPYFGFSEGTSFDMRSATPLSRNLSKSSTFTARTEQQTPVPLSAVSTRPSWYQISSDAPDLPPLVSKDNDLPSQ